MLNERFCTLFIGSTFSDLKTKRNRLQERVLPRLKHYCQSYGWSLQAIHLHRDILEGYCSS